MGEKELFMFKATSEIREMTEGPLGSRRSSLDLIFAPLSGLCTQRQGVWFSKGLYDPLIVGAWREAGINHAKPFCERGSLQGAGKTFPVKCRLGPEVKSSKTTRQKEDGDN